MISAQRRAMGMHPETFSGRAYSRRPCWTQGMKIMAIVDRHGLPLSVSTHAANHHEFRLVQLCIEMIAPHRANRSKPPTQDRRRLTRYTRRWLVERFFAWTAGNTTPRTSLDSFSSPALFSSSDDFEIDSSNQPTQSSCINFNWSGRGKEPEMPG